MKESILIKKDVFPLMYDKMVGKIVADPLKDSDTGHMKLLYNLSSKFKCNVQNTSGRVMLKEFGKEYDAEYRVSCSKAITVTEKNFIYKEGYIYQIVAFTETEQSKIFLIKRDDTFEASSIVNLQIEEGDLTAESYKDILDRLDITEEGVLEAAGVSEGISAVNDSGELIVDPVKITELLEDD